MTSESVILIYKLATIGSGVIFCYLGYLLFVKGIFSSSGDMDAQFGDFSLVMKKAAPGTFFALFGAAVISITILQGLKIYERDVPPADVPQLKGFEWINQIEGLPNPAFRGRIMEVLRNSSQFTAEDLEKIDIYIQVLENRAVGREREFIGELPSDMLPEGVKPDKRQS